MKIKIGIFAISMILMASCAKDDVFKDNGSIGQQLPTVSWELGSTVCKAGNNATFKGKYYPAPGFEILKSEIWASVIRQETAEATVKLTPTLAYTKTINKTDTVRSSQLVQSYDHSQAEWNGHEYILTASFPTSQTLSPVDWVAPTKWDDDKFNLYYPAKFKEEFKETIVNYLTKDSAYYVDLRSVYVNFDFKAEQFEALNAKYGFNFPTETELDVKSNLWYTDLSKVVGKYYITVENGITYYHEVPLDYVNPDVNLYDVYDSSFWVFCRMSDDIGAAMTSVRPQYMPYLKDLISYIKFEEWIYNSADLNYGVSFKRSYNLNPTYKVYDSNGKVGIDTDVKIIELN